jgi:TPR repeat protein
MRACHALAKLVRSGTGVEASPQKAAVLEQMACDADLAVACGALAAMTSSGEGVDQSVKRAGELWEREVKLRLQRCDSGSGDDCVELSRNYRSLGHTVRIDPAKAAEYEERAFKAWTVSCDAGDVNDCSSFAQYLDTMTVPDFKRATPVRARECSLGHDLPCVRLQIPVPAPRPP